MTHTPPAPSFARAVGRNTIIQFAGKVAGTALGLVTSVLILHYLHPAGNGSYSTAMAYLGFFSVVADLGLYLILIRDLSRPGADRQRIVGNLLALRWLSAALLLGAGAAVVAWLPLSPAEKTAVFIGTGSYIAVAATQLLVGVFQTNLAMRYVTGAELAGRVLLLGITWWVIRQHAGLNGIMIAVVGGSLLNFGLVWLFVRRFVQVRLRFDWAYWRSTLRTTVPIAMSIVLNLIYFRADTIILRAIKGTYDVGLYAAAYKILEILNTFPLMFVGLLLPVLGAAFANQDHPTFQRIFQRGFDFLIMAALPLLVGGALLAKPLMIFMGGADFAPAAPVFRWLLVAVSALYLGSLSGHVVTIINRQRQMVWSYLAVAVMGLIIYLTLIPRWSLYGAATGTIATEVTTAVVGYIMIMRTMHFRLSVSILPRLLLAAGLMSAAIWWLEKWHWWVALVVGALVYVVCLLITRTLSWTVIKDIVSPSARPDSRLSVEEPAP